MGVAATKTLDAQIAALYGFAISARQCCAARSTRRDATPWWRELDDLPELVDRTVAAVGPQVRQIALELAGSPFFLFLGRLAGLPVAMEGALKLKEITYIPTDAYPAGEMKHGPIALLGPGTPVVCVSLDRVVMRKLLSNLAEVRARGARVLAITGEATRDSDLSLGELAEHVVRIPAGDPLLQVILAVIPLQLFAYHVARARSLNVDQPRNLAKTVTVE